MDKRVAQPLAGILLLTYSSVVDDPRVLPVALALAPLERPVTVIGLALRSGLADRSRRDDIDIRFVPLFPSDGLGKGLIALWRWFRGNPSPVETTQRQTTNKLTALFFTLWALRIGLGLKLAAVHSHGHSPILAGWLLARWHRVPLVYDSCESVPDLFEQFPRTMMNRLTCWLEGALMPRADAITTVGQRLSERLKEHGARQVVLVGNWKDPAEYLVSADAVNTLRQRLQLPPHRLVIAFFGNLDSKTYDLPALIEAVEASREVVLLVSGQGEYRAAVHEAALCCPNIIWLDWIPMADLPVYINLADAIYCCLNMTFTQTYYVVPNKLFEAFAAGKVVIARRGVGEMGMILEQTKAGLLVDQAAASDLQQAFCQLKDASVLHSFQDRARTARLTYNWGEAVLNLQALYRRIIRA